MKTRRHVTAATTSLREGKLVARDVRRSNTARACRVVNEHLASLPTLKTTTCANIIAHAAGFARVAVSAWRARCRRKLRQVSFEAWSARQSYLIGVPNAIKKTFGDDVTLAFGNATFTRTRG